MSERGCERCGSKKNCCSIFMDYRMNLARLCSDCHEAYHAMLIKTQEMFMEEKTNANND